jgi:hypothetical protein
VFLLVFLISSRRLLSDDVSVAHIAYVPIHHSQSRPVQRRAFFTGANPALQRTPRNDRCPTIQVGAIGFKADFALEFDRISFNQEMPAFYETERSSPCPRKPRTGLYFDPHDYFRGPFCLKSTSILSAFIA